MTDWIWRAYARNACAVLLVPFSTTIRCPSMHIYTLLATLRNFMIKEIIVGSRFERSGKFQYFSNGIAWKAQEKINGRPEFQVVPRNFKEEGWINLTSIGDRGCLTCKLLCIIITLRHDNYSIGGTVRHSINWLFPSGSINYHMLYK